jgi:hypothetical protein
MTFPVRTPSAALTLLLLLAAACAQDEGADPGPPSPFTPDTGGVAPDPTFTWHEHIAPLVGTHCGSCHLPGGQGTGDFTEPATVAAFLPAIRASVEGGRMPPPASDPACHPYIGDDRWVVPPDFLDRLETWVDQGAPAGDPARARSVEPLRMRLEAPDLEVRMPAPYRPTFADPRNPGNEYRCFVVEHGQTEPFYIRAMAPVIDQPALVHHIVLFKARRRDVPAENDPITGYDCIDMTLFQGSGGVGALVAGDEGMISAWAPGSQAIEFAEGAGIRMEPDHVLIMQMHYFDGAPGQDLADLSGYEFVTTDIVDTEILMAPFGPSGFTIPAGDENHARELAFEMPLPLRLHGVMPHMHYLGQSYRMWFQDPEAEAEQCIVRSERYDFNNQLTYMFREPIEIPRRSTIGFGCTWNNSPSNPNLVVDPPQDIRYGERTDQEMCYGFSLISVD